MLTTKCVEAPSKLCRKLVTGAATAQGNVRFALIFSIEQCAEAPLKLRRKLLTASVHTKGKQVTFHPQPLLELPCKAKLLAGRTQKEDK